MKNCPTCGKECASEKGMKQHHTRSHGESLNDIYVECSYCSKEFDANYNNVKNYENNFCSDSCESKWRSKNYSGTNHPNSKSKVTLKCEYCDGEFEEYPYRADDARFCSQECSGKYKTEQGRSVISCDWCGNTYREENCKVEREENHFCSKKCYGSWQSVNRNGQDHPNWKGGASIYEAVRENISEESWSRIAESHRSERCYMCDKSTDEIHEHHIIPIMYGGINSEELLMSLCPHCHRKVEVYTTNMLEEVTSNLVEVA